MCRSQRGAVRKRVRLLLVAATRSCIEDDHLSLISHHHHLQPTGTSCRGSASTARPGSTPPPSSGRTPTRRTQTSSFSAYPSPSMRVFTPSRGSTSTAQSSPEVRTTTACAGGRGRRRLLRSCAVRIGASKRCSTTQSHVGHPAPPALAGDGNSAVDKSQYL